MPVFFFSAIILLHLKQQLQNLPPCVCVVCSGPLPFCSHQDFSHLISADLSSVSSVVCLSLLSALHFYLERGGLYDDDRI